jgi:hypothetical protein
MSTHSSLSSGKKPKLRVQIPEDTTLPPPQQVQNPPSALPSQFAQNLPSPSTFYPEFYQQNELPSPINFSATPQANNAFHWPSSSRDYKPSPLKPEG